ncbi:venom allergen 5-like [Venturia canescens]|uniref:venom allergen 5-like n=1 Tax=Venturia canescens TaxID=32260 RepID=UPI001C9D236B|nr:venom allergen 5-like [Venturia canescens]
MDKISSAYLLIVVTTFITDQVFCDGSPQAHQMPWQYPGDLRSKRQLAYGNNVDYCYLSFCRPNEDTLCRFSADRTSTYSMSIEEKNQVLSKHNELRQKIANGYESQGTTGGQPAAKNLYSLTEQQSFSLHPIGLGRNDRSWLWPCAIQ